MPFSFYDAIVPSNLQLLEAMDGLLVKAEAFCVEQARPESGLIEVTATIVP